MDFASKTQLCQVVEKIGGEPSSLLEEFDVISRERKVLKKMDHLFQACSHEEPTVRGQLADEETERGWRGHVVLEIACRHRQFIQVGKQGKAQLWCHRQKNGASLIPAGVD